MSKPRAKKPPASEPEGKRPGGRPTDFRPEYVEEARKLCELGATDIELADFFEVAPSTLYLWLNVHPKFSEAVKVGKETADDRVERSLFHKANGYSHPAVKIFLPRGATTPIYAPYREHVPPDSTAIIFWLKNRRREKWSDKQQHEHSGTLTLAQLVESSYGKKDGEPK